MKGEQLFLEDLRKGEAFRGVERLITDADVLSFAALTGDAHPLHYDDEYAKTTPFGRPIVHGLHLMALTALGATPFSRALQDSMIALVEQQASFRKPVFKNDTLQPEFEIEGVEHRAGKGWGHVVIKVRLLNQNKEVVLEGHHIYRIRSRAGMQAVRKA